ncbi:MAG TPA: ATP-binding cassette domain-containing protein [Candidatus Cloacimonetes bacterium]|nr:ATP-binding cassette domain-containing protein [Candidatus Cloacimonadota bacterium]
MLNIENFALLIEYEKLFTLDNFILSDKQKALIIGNNDTGKSLFLKAIHGEHTEFEGNIFIKEKPAIFYRKRKKTILIENSVKFLPKESIWKNIVLPLDKKKFNKEEKIIELCNIAGLGEIYNSNADNLSYSSQKLVELIRAVIQQPYLILIDDIDNYFDDIKMVRVNEIVKFALDNGTSIICTSKKKLDDFDISCRIQNGKMVQL